MRKEPGDCSGIDKCMGKAREEMVEQRKQRRKDCTKEVKSQGLRFCTCIGTYVSIRGPE